MCHPTQLSRHYLARHLPSEQNRPLFSERALLLRALAKTAEHRLLLRPGEDRQNPQEPTFPLMEDAKPAGIGLKGFAWQRRDRLDFPGQGPVCQPDEVVNQAGPLLSGDAVQIALRPAGQAHMFRDFACRQGSLSR